MICNGGVRGAGYSNGMSEQDKHFGGMVTALIPSLSKSLAAQFNVFRVMRYGTHEKQLSDVFAWMLTPDETHELGDAFQRIFVEQVNEHLTDSKKLPVNGYRITQEVNTSQKHESGQDIADVVLTRAGASIVIENFYTSDGHGHDYSKYLAYSQLEDRHGVVVLFSATRDAHLMRHGWEHSVSLTYQEVLKPLADHLSKNRAWVSANPNQNFFINQLFEHFLEGPGTVNVDDQLAFIETMCATGESTRYGKRPTKAASEEFASVVALHARRQFDDGRQLLAEIKDRLYASVKGSVVTQLNAILVEGKITKVRRNWTGQWLWSVTLHRDGEHPDFFFQFGPSAVSQNAAMPDPIASPDFSKIFVSSDTLQRTVQSDVSMKDLLEGLPAVDTRLRDSALELLGLKLSEG